MLENLEHCLNEDNIASNTTSDIDIDKDSSTYLDNTIINNTNTNTNTNTKTNTKIKLLLETYFELIYNKINSILSYFWTKKNIV